VSDSIPFAAWPQFDDGDVAAVADVLRSGKVNYWTGTEGRTFEREFAAFSGCHYAVAVANGTVAIELALTVCDIGPGDEVIVTSRTFVGSASPMVLRGASPVFSDVDPNSQNITAETIRQVLTPRTKAILCVHLAGWPCEMDSICELAKAHDLIVIEDCAQAHGARYKEKPVGSLGHLAAWSFCQDKIMTTGGEGGMLTTNDENIWKRAWAFKDHGKSYDTVYRTDHPPGFRWLHESFGSNWRLTEMQAVLGRRMLLKLPEWLAQRRQHAATLSEAFRSLPGLRCASPPRHSEHAYYKYYAFVRPEQLRAGWDRDRVMNAIVARGVPCYSGSCSEIYREKAFAGTGYVPKNRLPVARELGDTALMWLVHPTLSEEAIRWTAQVVSEVMFEATIATEG